MGNVTQDTGDFKDKWNELIEEVLVYYEYTDEKRMKYKKYVQIVNVTVSILYPLMTLCVSLSLNDILQMWTKIISLLLSTLGAMIPLVAKGFAWNEKLQQRTITYLKLDELLRDMRYEKSKNEDCLDRYVARYKAVVSADNEMGRENALSMGKHSENVTKDLENK